MIGHATTPGTDRHHGPPPTPSDPIGRFWSGLNKVQKILATLVALATLVLAGFQIWDQLPCGWKNTCPPDQEIRVTGYSGPEEWVELTNEGDDPVDLTRWLVRDAAGHTYEFMGTVLEPGASIVLHTGAGQDSATDVYWGREDRVWDDDTEQVVVINPERCEVDSYVH